MKKFNLHPKRAFKRNASIELNATSDTYIAHPKRNQQSCINCNELFEEETSETACTLHINTRKIVFKLLINFNHIIVLSKWKAINETENEQTPNWNVYVCKLKVSGKKFSRMFVCLLACGMPAIDGNDFELLFQKLLIIYSKKATTDRRADWWMDEQTNE